MNTKNGTMSGLRRLLLTLTASGMVFQAVTCSPQQIAAVASGIDAIAREFGDDGRNDDISALDWLNDEID